MPRDYVGVQLDAADEKGRKSAQQQVERQVGRLNNFSKELDNLRAMPPPKIEVSPGQSSSQSSCAVLNASWSCHPARVKMAGSIFRMAYVSAAAGSELVDSHSGHGP